MNRRYAIIIAMMIIMAPIGLLAEGTAWGEWGVDELQEQAGYVPAGIQLAADYGKALLPGYTLPMPGESKAARSMGYSLSALVGSAFVYYSIVLLAKMVKRLGRP